MISVFGPGTYPRFLYIPKAVKSNLVLIPNESRDFIDEEKAHGKYKDIRRRKPNLEKSKNLIGYVPKISFEESITKVINNDKV